MYSRGGIRGDPAIMKSKGTAHRGGKTREAQPVPDQPEGTVRNQPGGRNGGTTGRSEPENRASQQNWETPAAIKGKKDTEGRPSRERKKGRNHTQPTGASKSGSLPGSRSHTVVQNSSRERGELSPKVTPGPELERRSEEGLSTFPGSLSNKPDRNREHTFRYSFFLKKKG